MAEFFLELFSEEIPARMQKAAAAELERHCLHALQFLKPTEPKIFYGPRRVAFAANVNANDSAGKSDFSEAVGPREGAPEQAIEGFLRKHNADRSELIVENGKYYLRRRLAVISASEVVQVDLPKVLSRFPWPKSMRWGTSGDFTWVRPLRRIVCLLDGEVIPITLGPVTTGNETEGHRVHRPGAFAVSSAAVWEEKLREHYVIVNQDERRRKIAEGIAAKAAELGLSVAQDDALLDEVTGLVEWPVPLIGKIDEKFMDLPPEVRELSMKINQKYFALRDANGRPAPYFAFVANLAADDGGASITAGNERVLRARLSDARHFWDIDLKTPLNALLPKLEKITFHAKIGTQRQRADRIAALAMKIADTLNADGYESQQAHWAGLLCKADLVTGMVGEFPELQGVMGGYYAERSYRGWSGEIVGPAIKTHYQPKGPSDAVPTGTVAVSVALADKLYTLTKFFEINEKPTGSGDPYALRRAALGVIRIILENELRLPLTQFLMGDEDLFAFIIERLRVKLRSEGKNFDVLDAVLAIRRNDDLVRIMQRVNAISNFLGDNAGKNLLVAYRRAANILRIEDAKDGPHLPEQSSSNLATPEEINLQVALSSAGSEVLDAFNAGDFGTFIEWLATLRTPVDAFFDNVTINAPEPEFRLNRLGLLAQLRDRMHMIADFSKIEG